MTFTLTSVENMRLPTRRPVLGYYLLASLAVHALAVILWQVEPPAGPSARSSFEITVLARHGDIQDHSASATAQTRTMPSPARPVTASKDNRPDRSSGLTSTTGVQRTTQSAQTAHRPDAAPSRASAKAEVSAVAETDTAPTPQQLSTTHGANSHGQQELTRAARYHRVRTALHEALLPRFQYPSIARRRGWQGRVTVALHVEADGDLAGIRLLESSGYALLDKAAVRNVSELRNVPGATQWLDANGMDVVLPVRYQLEKH